MTDEDRVADLLLRWEELHAQGGQVSPEELCRDCPYLAPLLARRIHALQVTAWMDQPDGGDGDPPGPAAGPDAPPPRTLGGRYRLDGRIAEGGFAEVWRGYDLVLRRAVAIKTPKAGHLATGERAERFVAEARRVARLKHPGVVPVFDVGRDGGTCFIVSEVVEGGSLAERIAQGRPTPQEAARLVAEVAETLDYAHRQGFIHRDIKPGNILIDHHGRALLADFGIARAPDDADSGIVSFGTLAYMSPEQVEGRHVDHRTDIYSLGVVLYELLAGQLPHQGADPVQLRREIVSGPPPLFPDPATVPSQLAEICMKCLARNPADRYQDAAMLAADLRKPARKSFPARRLVVGLASLLLVAVIGLAVFSQQHRSISDQPNEPAIASKNDEAPSPAPGSLEAALALGKLHFNRKEWGEAETAFSEAIRLDPDCAEAYHLRAGSLFNGGKVKESLPDFDKAVALDPHNAELFKNRGIARLNLLHFDEALADLRHALELDPENPEPYRKVLGETFARRAFEHDRAKKWKEAVADMNEAIRLAPAFADYYDKRGSFHFNLRQFEEALKDFSEAIRLDPKQPAFFLHRGYAHQALGREEEAAEDFAKAQRAGGHSNASERLQRKTAEAILRGQGVIRVQGFGQPVTSLIGLPPGPVRIESADLPPGQPVDETVLRAFQGVPSLFALNLSQTQVTDDDLRFLRGLTGLRILRLNHTGITDKGLVHLTAIPNLEFLELKGTAITDEGMDTISRIEKLAWLEISETGITDQGLRRWKKQPGLQVLRANRNPRIGTAGLTGFNGLRSLYLLELVGTSVTPAAVEALRADLPTCEVRR